VRELINISALDMARNMENTGVSQRREVSMMRERGPDVWNMLRPIGGVQG